MFSNNFPYGFPYWFLDVGIRSFFLMFLIFELDAWCVNLLCGRLGDYFGSLAPPWEPWEQQKGPESEENPGKNIGKLWQLLGRFYGTYV